MGGEYVSAPHDAVCPWQSVEAHLRDAKADVLTIMGSRPAVGNIRDSRSHAERPLRDPNIDLLAMMNSDHAATNIKNNGQSNQRSFETLTGTYTLSYQPGNSSFTRALIDSLTDLHSDNVGIEHIPFDTTRLLHQIMRHLRSRGQSHIPSLFNRVEGRNARHICLASLTKLVPHRTSPVSRAKGILHLQIVFAKHRELNKDETIRLAGCLARAAKQADLGISSLDWVTFEPSAPRIGITLAVHRLLQRWVKDFRSRKRRAYGHARGRSPSRYQDESDDTDRPTKRLRTRPSEPLTPIEAPITSPRVTPESAKVRDATLQNIDLMLRSCLGKENGTLKCKLDWDLRSCIETDLRGESTLGKFLTVTGDAFSAYATTCSEWIRRTWGNLGMSVLQTTCEALVSGTRTSEHLTLRLNDHENAAGVADARIVYTDIEEAVVVVQTLTWLAATFRPPRGNSLHTSSATVVLDQGRLYVSLETPVKVGSDSSTSCWHSLLGNTIITRGFYTGDHGGGLELPSDLMLELTGMLYTTAPSGPASPSGTFHTGVHSILYPTEKNETQGFVKWHYAASDYVMIPPADGTWLRLRQDDLIGMRTILGYTPSVQVHLGTESRLHQYESMTASHAGREKDSWSFSWDGLTVQAGFAGSGVSSPFKFVRRTGQQGVPTAKPTYDQIIHGTSDKPVILYDTAHAQESAWLVPQLSVILDLVLFQAHRERAWKNLTATARAALHAKPYWNGGLAAKEVLDDYERANTVLRLSADDGTPVAIKHLVMQVFAAMSHRVQLDHLHSPSSSLTTSPLLGWDLIQLTDALAIPARLQIEVHKDGLNNSAPTWLPLAREIPVFFCDGLGDVMTTKVPICSQFQRSQKNLVASIHVLQTKRKRCLKCDEYHIDTKKQLVWQLPRSDCFSECVHGAHRTEDAIARFDAGVQLMFPASGCKRARSEVACPVIPEEGAVVFGAKRLRRG